MGVSRATLQRKISSGKLSVLADGTIDPSDMLRVFGEAKGGPDNGSHEPLEPPAGHNNESVLRAEIQTLRTALAAKDELIAAKNKHLDDLGQALRLLKGPEELPPNHSGPD
jgi:hypothetical protein